MTGKTINATAGYEDDDADLNEQLSKYAGSSGVSKPVGDDADTGADDAAKVKADLEAKAKEEAEAADAKAKEEADAKAKEEAEDEEAANKARDEKGRFTKKEDGGEESEEVDEDDVKNYGVRLSKALSQRDREREARERIEAENRQLREALAAKEKSAEPEKTPQQIEIEKLNTELSDLYEKVEELRADANTKDAAKIQRQIDETNRKISRLEADEIASRKATEVTSESNDTMLYNRMASQLEAYNVFNPESPDYSQALVDELEFNVAAYEKAGLSAPNALRRAATLLLRHDPWGPRKEEKAAESTKDEKKPEPRKPDPAKAADTSVRQPPDPSKHGTNVEDRKLRIADLSDEEFDNLPESKKRELRGDNRI